jgi:alkylation response protein AidB-like acyl-CoA dehydrogenase
MSAAISPYVAAEELERYLGDPADPRSPLSFERIVELDEQEVYPEAVCRLLYRWGFHRYYVPAALGGKLTSFEEILSLVRVISRRDLSVAISDAHTFLGSIPVWIGGDEGQKRALAEFVLNEGRACLALTERGHGSDLIACDTQAEEVEGGYRLHGEKWPINKATLTDCLTVLARTGDEASARGLSLFLVDKGRLAPFSYRTLPKVRTLGIRGCDISGIRFDGCVVPEEARVGAPGEGLELGLKGFQITRTLCGGLSLGAADTALRVTLDFARERRLYGRSVFELPHARRQLVGSFLDILVADCVATAGARAIHATPGQMSMVSAIVKYVAPTMMEEVMRDLSVVLGARYYMREQVQGGIFQKMVRDNAIISLFDGSTIVNLSGIALQLHTHSRLRAARGAAPVAEDTLAQLCALGAALPPFDPSRMDLNCRGRNLIVQALGTARGRLEALLACAGADPEVLEHLLWQADELTSDLERIEAAFLEPGLEFGREMSPELFDLAARYCRLHAAAASLFVWLHSREEQQAFFADGRWLVLALDRVLSSIRPREIAAPRAFAESVAAELVRRHEQDLLFGVVPLPLASARRREERTDSPATLALVG